MSPGRAARVGFSLLATVLLLLEADYARELWHIARFFCPGSNGYLDYAEPATLFAVIVGVPVGFALVVVAWVAFVGTEGPWRFVGYFGFVLVGGFLFELLVLRPPDSLCLGI